MENKKSLLELAKDLEILARDQKEATDNFFKNIFGFAKDLEDKSKEASGLSPENEEAINEELDYDHEQQMKQEEDLVHEEENI